MSASDDKQVRELRDKLKSEHGFVESPEKDDAMKSEKSARTAEDKKIQRTKSIELWTEFWHNSFIKYLGRFILFLVVFSLIWFIIAKFLNLGWLTPLVALLLTFLLTFWKPKPHETKGSAPSASSGGVSGGKRESLPIGKILLVLVLVLVGFWLYQGAQKGYISTDKIQDFASSSWLKTVGFLKDPFASVRDIGSWNKPAVEEKKVGVEITNIQKADYYSSGKPIRINGKIKIFALTDESVDVEMGCSLNDGDKEISKGKITAADQISQENAVINVKENEDAEYGFLCKFNEGAKVEKDEKGFNVLITVKYPHFTKVERLSVETIANFKETSREISSECRIGCGYYSGPVRLDLSTSRQPLTSVDSIYPLYISLSNVKENWKGSVTNIEKLRIGFSDFEPDKNECDSFTIDGNTAELKSEEINNIKAPVQCDAKNIVKSKFSNLDQCLEAARDKKEYDCWYNVKEDEFVEGSIPKKHYITAELVFDYEFKSSTSITVRA